MFISLKFLVDDNFSSWLLVFILYVIATQHANGRNLEIYSLLISVPKGMKRNLLNAVFSLLIKAEPAVLAKVNSQGSGT